MRLSHIVALICISCAAAFSGCATVFKGYFDEVEVYNLPNGSRIFTRDSVEIPVSRKIYMGKGKFYFPANGVYDTLIGDRTVNVINLRSNTDHVLVIKNKDSVTPVQVFPRLGAAWLVLDVVTGTFLVDMYTGAWNHFGNISLPEKK